MQKKNILFITHCIPYPLNSGGRQAIFNGIYCVREHYNIYIAFPSDGKTSTKKVQEELHAALGKEVTILPFVYQKMRVSRQPSSLKNKIVNKIRQYLDNICPPTVSFLNPYRYWIEELLPKPSQYIQFVNRIIKENDIDIVQCEMLKNLALVQSLPVNVQRVFVHHELGFVRHQLELSDMRDENFDGEAYLNSAKTLEVGQLNLFDHIITLSAADKRKLQDVGVKTPISESFAVVNSSALTTIESNEYHELAFIGPDNHLPNKIGLEWFLENCWNKLLERDVNYQLSIIGLWSEQNIKHFSSRYKNLKFFGFVSDLKKTLEKKILIVPITIGSGIRMKILEAASLGVPFVSTHVGAEGIPVENEVHGLLADTPEAFVDAIQKMKDENLRLNCIQNANEMVQEFYSLDALKVNRLNIYSSLYEKK